MSSSLAAAATSIGKFASSVAAKSALLEPLAATGEAVHSDSNLARPSQTAWQPGSRSQSGGVSSASHSGRVAVPSQPPTQLVAVSHSTLASEVNSQLPVQVPVQVPMQVPVQPPPRQVPRQVPSQTPEQAPSEPTEEQVPSHPPSQVPVHTPLQVPSQVPSHSPAHDPSQAAATSGVPSHEA